MAQIGWNVTVACYERHWMKRMDRKSGWILIFKTWCVNPLSVALYIAALSQMMRWARDSSLYRLLPPPKCEQDLSQHCHLQVFALCSLHVLKVPPFLVCYRKSVCRTLPGILACAGIHFKDLTWLQRSRSWSSHSIVVCQRWWHAWVERTLTTTAWFLPSLSYEFSHEEGKGLVVDR